MSILHNFLQYLPKLPCNITNLTFKANSTKHKKNKRTTSSYFLGVSPPAGPAPTINTERLSTLASRGFADAPSAANRRERPRGGGDRVPKVGWRKVGSCTPCCSGLTSDHLDQKYVNIAIKRMSIVPWNAAANFHKGEVIEAKYIVG